MIWKIDSEKSDKSLIENSGDRMLEKDDAVDLESIR